MYKEQKELRGVIHEIMWYLRGGCTREEAWCLSHQERIELVEDIKKRIENVEKSGLPIL